ncbi:MAG: DUF1311 domain-containing protein [Flavobacteriia bacterium]|nr:DUF1311 domain-containing protein [Flavobacteriia bacterium]
MLSLIWWKNTTMVKITLILMLLVGSYTFGQSQTEMNQEALKSYQIADAEMTVIYKDLMKSLGQTEKNYLLTAQRAWISYKEAHCKAIAYQYDGGSMQPMVQCACLETLTRERIQQLNAYNP